MVLVPTLGLFGAIPLAACVVSFLRARGSAGWWKTWMRAVGWLALCVFPAAIYQMIGFACDFWSSGADWPEALSGIPISWWVLMGGASVQAVFEETAKDISGHRQLTMIDNWPWYATLTFFQTLPVAAIVAVTWKRKVSWRHPVAILAGCAVLANAVLGAPWPWWGS